MWLQALSLIGARACILLGALQPCVAALAGGVFLGQPLHARLLLGTALTSTGLVAAHLGRTASLRAMGRRLATRLATLNDEWIEQLTEQRRQEEEYGLPDTCKGGDLVFANGVLLGLLQLLPRSRSGAEDGGEGGSKDGGEGGDEGGASKAENNAGSSLPPRVAPRTLLIGYTLALTNMVLDVLGATLTRAHGGGATTFEVNALRFGFASLVTACVTLGARLRAASAPSVAPEQDTEEPAAWAGLPTLSACEWRRMACGVVLVTFLCPALSNYALFRLPLGAWASLTALGPVYAIPIFYVLRGEGTRLLGVLGAALASCGAALVSA